MVVIMVLIYKIYHVTQMRFPYFDDADRIDQSSAKILRVMVFFS